MSDAERPAHFKDVLLLTQLFHIPIFFVSIGLSVDPDPDNQWTRTLLYLHPILCIFLFAGVIAGIIGLKLLLVAWDKCFDSEESTKCRRDLSIGYGGMITCGIIPQVLKVILMENVKDVLAFSAICAVCNFLFLLLFVFNHHDDYGTRNSKKKYALILRIIMILLHVTVTVTLVKVFIRGGKYNEKQIEHMEILIALYSFCYIPCPAEFAVVLAGWITVEELPDDNISALFMSVAISRELYPAPHRPTTNQSPWVDTVLPSRSSERYESLDDTGNFVSNDSELFEYQTCRHHTADHQEFQHIVRVTVPTAPMEEEEDETTDSENLQYPISSSTSGTECNICMLRYSTTTVIPRILVGCGHTVCQACIQKLPRQEFVLCPFCRKPTSLPDNLLPKNYAVLDIIHNLEK
ncbi:hypothetical protein GCK72_011360 [Caenorhabditis remanei]|uniref:RING-type domain-containing protein n=1 Tax=Caenorhabditis remanei TaxID=31234 RepID=A0A6A5H7K4_CAERE|nr:hypothetical protein GCK72_011360 [Caenorhabditis remanei]KAF1763095.1 hypothetical protein GCK72_011360 [Caenorhabditis remanei]